MAQWYCCVGGRQYGPVPDEVLREWAAAGRVGPRDSVWAQGMPEWAPAASVPGLFVGPLPAAGAASVAAGGPGQTPVPPPGGTGGTTGVVDLMGRAWRGMSGRWGIAIGFALLALLVQMGVQMVSCVVGMAMLILGGPLALGAAVFFLTYVRGGNAEIGMLFIGFRNFASALAVYLLTALLVMVWMLLVALPGVVLGVIVLAATREPIPALVIGGVAGLLPGYVAGVVASLRYSQSLFVLADNPRIAPLEAIRASKRWMSGHKLRLFALWLLLGLIVLACMVVICVGWIVGLVFMMPYAQVCMACFHDDLHPPRARQPSSIAPAGPGPLPTSAPAP